MNDATRASGSPRPRILITSAEEVTGERWADYADRVAAAGGEPIECALADWQPEAVTEYDGLLLTLQLHARTQHVDVGTNAGLMR